MSLAGLVVTIVAVPAAVALAFLILTGRGLPAPVRILLIGAYSAGACLLAKSLLGGDAGQSTVAASAGNTPGVVPFTIPPQSIVHAASAVLPVSILIAAAGTVMTAWQMTFRPSGGCR